METVHFRKIPTPVNYVELRNFMQYIDTNRLEYKTKYNSKTTSFTLLFTSWSDNSALRGILIDV